MDIIKEKNRQGKECQTFTIEKNKMFRMLVGKVRFSDRKCEEML